jgi:hypothetical protein
MSMPRKPSSERAIGVRISMKAALLQKVLWALEREGYNSLTNLVVYVLTQWLKQIEQLSVEKVDQKATVVKVDSKAIVARAKAQRAEARAYYWRNRKQLLAKAREKRIKMKGPPKPRGRKPGSGSWGGQQPRFTRNDEEILRGLVFYAAYDEGSHTITRLKPISDKARRQIDALFTNPPKYDAPNK